MDQVMTWIGPTLDVAAVVLLGLVLWRLGREPGTAWSEREARLKTIFDDLRALVAQSEGLARDLDEKLAGRETRLQALLAEAQKALAEGKRNAPERPERIQVRDDASPATAAAGASTADASPAVTRVSAADPAESARRIGELAEDGVAIEEIARRVGVAAAEVRLVIGLNAARTARRRAASTETRAHA